GAARAYRHGLAARERGGGGGIEARAGSNSRSQAGACRSRFRRSRESGKPHEKSVIMGRAFAGTTEEQTGSPLREPGHACGPINASLTKTHKFALLRQSLRLTPAEPTPASAATNCSTDSRRLRCPRR